MDLQPNALMQSRVHAGSSSSLEPRQAGKESRPSKGPKGLSLRKPASGGQLGLPAPPPSRVPSQQAATMQGQVAAGFSSMAGEPLQLAHADTCPCRSYDTLLCSTRHMCGTAAL